MLDYSIFIKLLKKVDNLILTMNLYKIMDRISNI